MASEISQIAENETIDKRFLKRIAVEKSEQIQNDSMVGKAATMH